MKYWLIIVLGVVLSCKGKTAEQQEVEEAGSFPVLSVLQSQVNHVDTSLYSIMKIHTVNGKADTSYIPREDFRKAANEFLSIPDISTDKMKSQYNEVRQFDEQLNHIVLDYSAKDPSAEIHREQVFIKPDDNSDGQVKTIFIEHNQRSKDKVVLKKMLWEIDHYFQIITMTQLPGNKENIEIQKVIWNSPR